MKKKPVHLIEWSNKSKFLKECTMCHYWSILLVYVRLIYKAASIPVIVNVLVCEKNLRCWLVNIRKISFLKSIEKRRGCSLAFLFSFGNKHLCSAQVFLVLWILPLPVSVWYQLPLTLGPQEMQVCVKPCLLSYLQDCIRDKRMKHLLHSFSNPVPLPCYLLWLGNLENL